MNRILVCLLLFFGTGVCMAFDSQDDKSYERECRKVSSQLRKDGWKMYGSNLPLETALMEYNRRQDTEHLLSIIGCGSEASVNVALRKAVKHATVQYAALRGSSIKGRTTAGMSSSVADGSVEQVSSGSVTSVSQTVKTLEQSFTLTRQLPDGVVEVRIYYLVKP